MTEDQRTEVGAGYLSEEQLELGGLLQALRRLEVGEYGLCTECGSEISMDRLKVSVPTGKISRIEHRLHGPDLDFPRWCSGT